MKKKNYEFLINQVKYSGYNNEPLMNDNIKYMMELGVPKFELRHDRIKGEDLEKTELYFNYSEKNKNYYFNGVKVQIDKPDGTQLSANIRFPKSHTYTSKEIYNMLHGRSVCKEKAFFKEGSDKPTKYKEWDTLNLNQKSNDGVHPVGSDKFYGFDKEIDKLGAGIFASDADRASFKRELEKGERPRLSVVEDGKIFAKWFQANPAEGVIDVYDKDGNKIKAEVSQQEGNKIESPEHGKNLKTTADNNAKTVSPAKQKEKRIPAAKNRNGKAVAEATGRKKNSETPKRGRRVA